MRKTDGEKAEEYDVFQQVGHLLRRAYQRHLAIFQENAGDENITSVQFVVLCTLNDNGPLSQIDLVTLTAIDQATIRGIIERLCARSLVSLSKDKNDGRKVIVSLTPLGRDLVETMIPRALNISKLTMGSLNPAEQVALTYALRRMIGDAS